MKSRNMKKQSQLQNIEGHEIYIHYHIQPFAFESTFQREF